MKIIDAIDNYLLNRERRPTKSHHPSSANACLRQLYYKWTAEVISNPSTAGNLWKMEMGNAIHDITAKFLIDAGILTMTEVAFKYKVDGLEAPISGRIDNIIVDDDGVASGIEVKTSFGHGIKWIQKTGKPKLEHLIQIAIYLHCTNIKRFYLVYIGRDNAYRTEFRYDNSIPGIDISNIVQRFKEVEKAVQTKEIPDRDYSVVIKNGEIKDKVQKDKVVTKSDWQCMYCDYKDLCWKKELDKK